ncbi:nicotinate-nicotinamide nucleotide adenylyltransferase [Candidatus Enterovibrio altilux]|uniref:nicotinate-nucleotide adenylyltransferase n=1 Tax=Candidatus Enterovibrio altilux TaxID=1927128 RepID=A0A291BAV3_9GAMM|nr:nicotinate-nicotinamide nucleotide adenylyltransferase [Candidatus Enterovibrio luxaltus]ATF10122.1 Nicotinate-nucleotide adenylyltransferase [Candidatus Enterovibrio luxaltus]
MNNQHEQKHIAVFGSAFNPPSLGHLSVIKRLSHFDTVLLVPSVVHAWGKKMADFDKRCDWVNEFITDVNISNAFLCADERDISKNTLVTTWILLSHLQNQYPCSLLTFVIGPDNFLNFMKFYKAKEIIKKWSILTCPETVKVRSTHIRDALQRGEDISSLTTPRLVITLEKKDCL